MKKKIFQSLLAAALISSAFAAGKKPVFTDFDAPALSETNAAAARASITTNAATVRASITNNAAAPRATTPKNLASAPAQPAQESVAATPASPTTDLESTLEAAAQYESGQSLEPLRRLEEGVRQSTSRPQVRKEIEQGLIQLLGTNATFEARRFAAKQLGIIGSTAALPALRQLLQDEDAAALACLALTTYPPGKADQMLQAALGSAPPKSRVAILNTMGDRKDAKAFELLTHAATEPDLAVAEAAIASLGKLGTPAAAKALYSLPAARKQELPQAISEARLRCADARLAEHDTKAARELYGDLFQSSDSIAVRRAALAVLLNTDRDGGEARITEVLASKDEGLKPVAIQRIASVPGFNASENFAREMHHLSVENQALLITSLALRNDDAARLELAKSLSSAEPIVRRAAIVALGRMGDPYFVSLLARAANTGDADETKDIETALVALKGGAETDNRMIAEVKNALPKARVPLIGAVAHRQGAAANSLLLEEVNNSDPSVAKAALRALSKTGTGTEAIALVTNLPSLHDPGVRGEAQRAASHLLTKVSDPDKRFAPVKETMDKCTTTDTRLALFELLPVCGTTDALALLTTAAQDPEPPVKEAAVRALAQWPDQTAWEALLAIYQQPDADSTSGIALRGMVRLLNEESTNPDAVLVARYRQLFASARSQADLKLLLGSISTVPDPDALSLVVRYMSHPAAQREAAAAAANIVETIKAKRPDLAEEAQKRLQARPVAPTTGPEGSAVLN